MTRDQFTFFRSFWEAIRRIRRKSDRLSALEGIISYALDGVEPQLTYEAEGVFILIRPTLDASRRKAENGSGKAKQHGSKQKAKRKQTVNEGEIEKEGEIEVEKENECSHNVVDVVVGAAEDDDHDDDHNRDGRRTVFAPGETDEGAVHPVISAFCSRIAPSPSETCLRELLDFSDRLGTALVLRAIDTAVDAGVRSWNYVRAVLRDWQKRGIRSVEELERAEERRRAKRQGAAEPADRNAWMDEYL